MKYLDIPIAALKDKSQRPRKLKGSEVRNANAVIAAYLAGPFLYQFINEQGRRSRVMRCDSRNECEFACCVVKQGSAVVIQPYRVIDKNGRPVPVLAMKGESVNCAQQIARHFERGGFHYQIANPLVPSRFCDPGDHQILSHLKEIVRTRPIIVRPI